MKRQKPEYYQAKYNCKNCGSKNVVRMKNKLDPWINDTVSGYCFDCRCNWLSQSIDRVYISK